MEVKTIFLDKCTLLEIFPLEIWWKVLDFAGSGDLISAYHSSPFFTEILRPYRQTTLFELIVKYVLPFLPNVLVPSCTVKWLKDDYESAPTAGLILLTCRLVSRDWNKAVIVFVQNKKPHLGLATVTGFYPGRSEYYYRIPPNLTYFRYKFEETAELEDFENHFGLSHFKSNNCNKNPVPSRYMSITIHASRTEYHAQLERVLKLFGHHIWYCHFRVQSDNSDSSYDECWRVLKLLPKLKILTIHIEPSETNVGKQITSEPLENLPVLFQLKHIKISGEQSQEFLEKFMSKNPHVVSLEPSNLEKLGIKKEDFPEPKFVY